MPTDENTTNTASAENQAQSQTNTAPAEQHEELTTKQLQAMMAREKREGRLALLKELGVSVEDEKSAKATVAAFLAHQDSQKTELQKAQDKVKEMEQAAKRAEIAELKLEIVKDGGSGDLLDELLVIAASKCGSGADIKTVLEEMKADVKYAYFFGKVVPSGTGSSVAGRKPAAVLGGLGARLAAQAKAGESAKNSYFKS